MNDSVGVDHIAHKHLIAPLVRLDLATDSGFSLLMELISNPNCMYVHFAPPCGTASRKLLGPNCVGTSYVVLRCGSVPVPRHPARRLRGPTRVAQ